MMTKPARLALPFLLAAAWPQGAAAQMSQDAFNAMQALSNNCKGMIEYKPSPRVNVLRKTHERIKIQRIGVVEKVFDCLAETRKQVYAFYSQHVRMFGPDSKAAEQNADIAGLSAGRITGACKDLVFPFFTHGASPDDAILKSTGTIIQCLNAMSRTTQLRTIRVPFDSARHDVIAQIAVCVRGMVDDRASADCQRLSKNMPH